MSFFKKLFGAKQQPEEDTSFTAFFNDTVNRYYSDPTGQMKVEFTANDGTIAPPQIVVPDTYKQWKEIRSIWDKRSVIFKALDEKCMSSLEHWQLIERLIIDRMPRQGYAYLKEECTPEDFKEVELLVSAARCNFYLSHYEKALDYAQEALAKDADNKRGKLILADILHLTHRHAEAHDLYNAVLEDSKLKDAGNTEISLYQIVDFTNDIMHSSVYAVSLLSSAEVNEDMWDKVATEFYHCPYFRSQHAFWLFKKNENLKGIAKLIVVTQEFPWYKDAVVNAKSSILQFRQGMKKDDLMQAELQHIEKIIAANNWAE